MENLDTLPTKRMESETVLFEITLKNGRNAILRPYESEDKEGLVQLYAGLSPEALRWSLPPYDRGRIEHWTSNLTNAIMLLACHNDKVVGHLYIFQLPFTRLKGTGELIIYLHQDFRSVGLGTAMMKEGIELARRKKLHRIGLSVVADNRPAIRVYERVGFKHEGIRREDYLGDDGLYHDVIEMGLLL